MWNLTQNDRAAWLKGPTACCSEPPSATLRPRRLVLLGAPGTGKGTLVRWIAEQVAANPVAAGFAAGNLIETALKLRSIRVWLGSTAEISKRTSWAPDADRRGGRWCT